MTKRNKTILNNRIKSFVWRYGLFLVLGVIGFILENEGIIDIPAEGVVIPLLAYIGGEITKYLNSNK